MSRPGSPALISQNCLQSGLLGGRYSCLIDLIDAVLALVEISNP